MGAPNRLCLSLGWSGVDCDQIVWLNGHGMLVIGLVLFAAALMVRGRVQSKRARGI